MAQPGYTSPIGAQSVMRGPIPVAVQVCKSDTPTALPDGKRLFYGLKLPSALKGDWLALAELLPSDEEGAVGLYVGTLYLNNEVIRPAMHAEISDPTPELASLPCLAEHFYTDADGHSNAVPASPNFSFVITSPLVNGTEGVSPNPNPDWPSAATVNSVVSAVAAMTPFFNLLMAGFFLVAPFSCDFRKPRNAMYA